MTGESASELVRAHTHTRFPMWATDPLCMWSCLNTVNSMLQSKGQKVDH